MKSLSSVWKHLRRLKYVVVLAFIILIDGFVDENSFWNARMRRERIALLQTELQLLRQKYAEDTRRYELLSQRHELERVARERYHMKRADEDVFVIYDEEKAWQPQTDSTAYLPIER
ncbi:MAG: septum formation initiator family protein [Bacteroidaceae bacterium]